MRVLEYTADGSRLDVLLSQDGALSRSRAAELIKGGAVTVDGRAEGKPSAKPAPGALVRVEVPEPRPAQAEAQDIPLKILYQDAHLAVVVKPCGMVVHPAAGNPDGTLSTPCCTIWISSAASGANCGRASCTGWIRIPAACCLWPRMMRRIRRCRRN